MDAMQKLGEMCGYARVEQEGEPRLHEIAIKSAHSQTKWEVFHAQMGGGKTIPLLKTMLTSICVNDCNYCVFRDKRDFPRYSFSPNEMANIFMQMVRKGLVRGIFLSSGIAGTGVKSQDRLIDTIEIIRKKYQFKGYVHLKIMPGAQESQIQRAMQISNRVSINLEGPNPERLKLLAPSKDFQQDLLPRIAMMDRYRMNQPAEERSASLTTQLVMGAVGENDLEMLSISELLYNRYHLARVYYSKFNPAVDTPLQNHPPADSIRNLRLYQASFLLRDYGFAMEDLPFQTNGFLPQKMDPKLAWASENLQENPVEINLASKEELIRIPGIGVQGAEKLVQARKIKTLTNLQQVQSLGISVQRAKRFVLLSGKRPEYQLDLGLSDQR
jgi:predicted DNA-binding helix-hairpin-helix protein